MIVTIKLEKAGTLELRIAKRLMFKITDLTISAAMIYSSDLNFIQSMAKYEEDEDGNPVEKKLERLDLSGINDYVINDYYRNFLTDNQFKNCRSLKTVLLPACLKEIKYRCFQDCTNLTEITLPSNLKYIYESAFSGCTNLKVIHCKMETMTPPLNTFPVEIMETCKLYVPKGYGDNYQLAWGFDNVIEVGEEEIESVNNQIEL
jgi:hypothetical protein